MDPRSLVSKYRMHPRCTILSGSLAVRSKASSVTTGSISGCTPHYMTKGCPPVAFNGTNLVKDHNEGAAIEVGFMDDGLPVEGALSSYGPTYNVIHLPFGKNGIPPTADQARLLTEAGSIFQMFIGKTVHFVVLPLLIASRFGVPTGRFYPLALFDDSGTLWWLHPNARPDAVDAEFPPGQKQRSAGATSAPPQMENDPSVWYATLSAVLKSAGVSGNKLHQTTLEAVAKQLVATGAQPNLSKAMAAAKKSFAHSTAVANQARHHATL